MTDDSKQDDNGKGRKPDYRVTTPVSKKDGSFFVDIGAGWKFDNDKTTGVRVKLNALPVNAEIILFEIKG